MTKDTQQSLPRRLLLKTLGATSVGPALAGCTDLSYTFEANSVAIRQPETLGYVESSRETFATELSPGIRGLSGKFEAIHKLAIYSQTGSSPEERKERLRPNGNRLSNNNPLAPEIGTKRVGLLATPNASIAGRKFNPLASAEFEDLLSNDVGADLLNAAGIGRDRDVNWIREPFYVTNIDGTTSAAPGDSIPSGRPQSSRSVWQYEWQIGESGEVDHNGRVVELDISPGPEGTDNADQATSTVSHAISYSVSNPHAGIVGDVTLEFSIEGISEPVPVRFAVYDRAKFPHQATLTVEFGNRAFNSLSVDILVRDRERCPGQSGERSTASQTIEQDQRRLSFDYSIAQPCGIKFPETTFDSAGITEVYVGTYVPDDGGEPSLALMNVAKGRRKDDTVFAAVISDRPLPESVDPSAESIVGPDKFVSETEIVEYQDGNDIILRKDSDGGQNDGPQKKSSQR